MALGNGSMTVAITSMASSLELPESPFFFSSLNGFAIVSCVAHLYIQTNPLKHFTSCRVAAQHAAPLQNLPGRAGYFFRPGQNPRAIGGYRHGVLEMRRGAAVRRFRHPLIPHAQ